MIITNQSIFNFIKSKKNVGVAIVENPRVVFFLLHNYLSGQEDYKNKRFKTEIGNDCNISKKAFIAEENVIIGENVTIEEFAVIYENTRIGDNSIVRSRVKIAGEGFEFKQQNAVIFPVKHMGGVLIGKNVEIQYNTCIDKAVYPWDNTVVDDFVKIDNLVHIGHAAKIGRNTMIVAKSGIGGRTTIENDCWIGFGSTIRNGIHIGQKARINMGAVVTKDVGSNESVTGNFAVDHDLFINHIKSIII